MTERREPKDTGNRTSGHLGGARADFVASLGRKVEQARELLGVVEARAASSEPRDELRRRLHALCVSAKMLHFDVMVQTLTEADGIFDRIGKADVIGAADVSELAQVLDDLPALAWSDVPKNPPTPGAAGAASQGKAAPPASQPTVEPFKPLTRSCIVFGSELLAEAMTDEAYDGPTFECERTEHVQAAVGLTRSIAPDVVIVDADIPAAIELVTTLLDDALTESVPILVVGSFATAEDAPRFVALGVSKTIPKPISPEALRAACDEAIATREGRTVRVSLGEPTLEQLGERLAAEVRQALVESVDKAARGVRVPLGEGTEVMGALWGAIARVREVVASRTDGAVRFGSRGPDGAFALAPWLHNDVPRGDRTASRTRGPAADVRLTGRKVVVADDDPGVTWFIADLLRTAGCQVFEALDGARALELCYEHSPELVVSDILMPGLDGFALSRALRRDVVLRDTPVVLLSWKEDLLQRVRELGASAAAYLRKESDSRAIVARVREVLRPRARVEARIKFAGEVRGRLDGLSVPSLLGLVSSMRPNSRLSVRDASFLYELEIRAGAPRRATRTAGDGSFQRGTAVLSALLGVSAGRFTVADSETPLAGDLRGTLKEQLAPAIVLARGAAHAVTGSRLVGVERVDLDADLVEAYLRATPEPARDLVRRFAEGASPRALLFGGGAEPSLVEDVLVDLAARGAIVGVQGPGGVDVLSPAVERVRTVMQGDDVSLSAPPRAKTASGTPGPQGAMRSPSSMADAVRRELSASTNQTALSSTPPPLVEPKKLRPRSSTPPGDLEALPLLVSAMNKATVEAARTATGARDTEAVFSELSDKTDVEKARVEAESIPIPIDHSRPTAAATTRDTERSRTSERPEKTPLSTVSISDAPLPMKARSRWTYGVVLAAAAAVVWVALQTGRSAPPDPPLAHPATDTPAQNVPARAVEPVYVDVPDDTVLAAGEGLLVISMPHEAPIKVDGVPRGRGPKLSLVVKAGSHDVLLGMAEHPRPIDVRAGRATRLELPETP